MNAPKLFKYATIFMSIALLALTSFVIVGSEGGHVIPQMKVNVAYVFQLADGAGGVETINGQEGNLITDIGDQFIVNVTTGRTIASYTYGTNNTAYIALGNGTSLAYADTQLTTEVPASNTGFARSALLTPTYATGTGIGNGYYFNFTITKTFTATAITTINATAVHWSGAKVSNNNMFAEASIGTLPAGQAFAVGDNCTITYTFTEQH